jgi:hypothetical protein
MDSLQKDALLGFIMSLTEHVIDLQVFYLWLDRREKKKKTTKKQSREITDQLGQDSPLTLLTCLLLTIY